MSSTSSLIPRWHPSRVQELFPMNTKTHFWELKTPRWFSSGSNTGKTYFGRDVRPQPSDTFLSRYQSRHGWFASWNPSGHNLKACYSRWNWHTDKKSLRYFFRKCSRNAPVSIQARSNLRLITWPAECVSCTFGGKRSKSVPVTSSEKPRIWKMRWLRVGWRSEGEKSRTWTRLTR